MLISSRRDIPFKIHLISSHLRLGLPSGLLPSSFPTKLRHAFILCPVRFTCPCHLILHMITVVIWRASLCKFLLLWLSPSQAQVSSSAPCSRIPSVNVSSYVVTLLNQKRRGEWDMCKMKSRYSVLISVVRRVYWGQLDDSGTTVWMDVGEIRSL